MISKIPTFSQYILSKVKIIFNQIRNQIFIYKNFIFSFSISQAPFYDFFNVREFNLKLYYHTRLLKFLAEGSFRNVWKSVGNKLFLMNRKTFSLISVPINISNSSYPRTKKEAQRKKRNFSSIFRLQAKTHKFENIKSEWITSSGISMMLVCWNLTQTKCGLSWASLIHPFYRGFYSKGYATSCWWKQKLTFAAAIHLSSSIMQKIINLSGRRVGRCDEQKKVGSWEWKKKCLKKMCMAMMKSNSRHCFVHNEAIFSFAFPQTQHNKYR